MYFQQRSTKDSDSDSEV